ncbi:MAG: hypothetical protein ACRDJW_08880 [Thermomicrobiales bacterium]
MPDPKGGKSSVPGAKEGKSSGTRSGFAPPSEDEASASEENAGVQFQVPSETLTEQAAFTAAPQSMAGISSQLLDAREALEEAIHRQERASGVQSVEAFVSDVGNIQGVGIGMSEPGGPGTPGEPTLAVFVAEQTSIDQVRSVVVESFGVEAAGDLPLSVHESGVFDAQSHHFYIRPAPGGVSIGHPRVTAGTLGCLSIGRSAPRNSRLMLLSNNHVIANSNNAVFGDCISQPGRYDGGSCPAYQIAILERFIPIAFGGATNYVDCATGWCWPDRVRRELIYLYSGTRQFFRISSQPLYPQLGWNVGKSGRTTQLTVGRIVALNWSGWINYGVGYAWFAGQFVVQGFSGNFSAGGDSGSSVWTWDSTRYPVGLLFAGGGGYTICNPMPWVVSALDINLYT